MMECGNIEVLILLHPEGVNPAESVKIENEFN
jgi:hypothetical protein